MARSHNRFSCFVGVLCFVLSPFTGSSDPFSYVCSELELSNLIRQRDSVLRSTAATSPRGDAQGHNTEAKRRGESTRVTFDRVLLTFRGILVINVTP